MLKTVIVLHFFLLLLQGIPASGNDELPYILEGIRKNYGHLPGLVIPYTREVITRSMTMLGNQVKGDMATGEMYFSPPHFLRLEQETPKPETIIANEETIWWYIPDKKCAYHYPSGEFGQELRLLNDIFSGLTQVEENFQVAMLGLNSRGEHRIELRPNPPWQEVDSITLAVTSGHHIRVVDIHNLLGSITRLSLGDLTVKNKFEEGFFRFVVPEGVHVVRKGE